ncbi:hypothetical protein KVV02_000379 [Mortierella alpina]|uniref:Uncharacterized protein n=1 Tax=Mortierella alpina TaxID=64518 RepID=A0A9P7ZZ73_MORAP|nr:hypothetical protein KVV02_000379 [Mortierella alpina]
MRAFNRACIEAIETRIRKEVAPKLKKGTGLDLTAGLQKVQEHLLNKDVVHSEYDQAWTRTVGAAEAAADRTADRVVKDGAEDNTKEDIITCPAQKSITDTISEPAALAHKAVILMAAGQFYEGDLELPSSAPRTLDKREILPQGYPLPEGFDPVVHIAPLPHKLQDHLLENPRGDMYNIQSHYFLQSLYTSFLSVQQAKRRTNNEADFDPATATMIKNHPLWTKIVPLIHDTTNTMDLVEPVEGSGNGAAHYCHPRQLAHQEGWDEVPEGGQVSDLAPVQAYDNADTTLAVAAAVTVMFESLDDELESSEEEGNVGAGSVVPRSIRSPLTGCTRVVMEKEPPRKAAFKYSDFTLHEREVVAFLANMLRPYVPKRRSFIVNDFTAHLVGIRIKHGELRASGAPRTGHPVSSRYDEEKKNKRRVSYQSHVDQELAASGLSRSDICAKIAEIGTAIRKKEGVVKAMRANAKEKQKIQTAASEALRKADDDQKAAAYAELRLARIQLRTARVRLIPRSTALAQACQELYYYNKLEKATKPLYEVADEEDSDESENSEDQSSKSDLGTDSHDSNEDSHDSDEDADVGNKETDERADEDMNEDMEKDMEDRTEEKMVDGTEEGADEGTNEDMEEETDQSADEGTNEERETSSQRPSCLAGENVVLGFGGTDNCLAIMSHTIAQSQVELARRIASYSNVISARCDIKTRAARVKEIKLPPAFTITARQIDSISHSHRNAKAREKLLKGDGCKLVRDALASIPTIGSLDRARTTNDLDQAMKASRAARDTLQAFETTKARNKQLHTQSLRTQRAYTTLCANERKYVQEHSAKDEPSQVSPDDG